MAGLSLSLLWWGAPWQQAASSMAWPVPEAPGAGRTYANCLRNYYYFKASYKSIWFTILPTCSFLGRSVT